MRPIACHVGGVCFAHWPVDPDVLSTRLPHALSVATRDGTGWVSVLGMRTRPMVGSTPLPPAFSQVTLRTYVRAGDEEAVYFLRVDTDSRMVAAGARAIFDVGFRRVAANVRADDGEVRVETHAPTGTPLLDATFATRDEPKSVDPDSLAGWLTDRDTFALDDGRTGEVSHSPWRLAEVDVSVRTNDVLASEGLPAPAGDPLFRYSPGAGFRLRSWPSPP